MPKLRLGVALLVPPPHDREVDGLRRALGDPALARLPPHLTLVPPVNVRPERLGDALARLRQAAAEARPLTLRLGPPGTFLPVSPVLHLAVSGDLDALTSLRERVFRDPLARPLTWPFVPHVTLADEARPERIRAALDVLADYRAEVTVEAVHLLAEGEGRRWSPIADVALARPAVVGEGGLALQIVRSATPDPEATAMVEGAGGELGPGWPVWATGAGTPVVLTVRREGRVVGLAQGTVGDDRARLGHLVVPPGERDQGIGTQLLAAFESFAAERGAECVVASRPPGSREEGFLLGRGWRRAPNVVERAVDVGHRQPMPPSK